MSVLAFKGFETGDASELPSLSTGWTISTTVKRTGAYSLKEDLSALSGFQVQSIENGLSVGGETWTRIAFHTIVTGTPNADAQWNLRFHGGGNIKAQIALAGDITGGVELFAYYVKADLSFVAVISALPVTSGAHHVLEVHVKTGSGTGVFEVFMDGLTLYSATGLDISTTAIEEVDLVGQRQNGVNYLITYWDDYARGDSRIGQGRVIARQGLAGTPNADAFTKTSSQTAAQVWSETPFSATNEAHSTDQNQAQTMLVDDVGAGTDPISATDIINACKVVAIAKEIGAASGTPTYSIRRRLNSSNTDTAKALTGSDSLIDDGIWTDTRTNLQSAEIGAVRGSGVDTVAIVTAGTEGSAGSGNVTPGLPGSLAANDILICVCHSTDQVAHSMNATYWTQIRQGNGGGTTSRLSTWWHRYDGSTDPDRVVTHTAGDTIIAGIVAYRGCVRTGSPINTSSAVATGTDATMEASTITPSVDGCMLLHCHGAGDDNNVTQLSGWTARFEDSGGGTQNAFVSTTGTDGLVGVQDQLQAAKGATGTITVTQAASDAWACCLVALTPAAKHLQVEDMWLMVDYTVSAGRVTKNTRAWPLGTEIGMGYRMEA